MRVFDASAYTDKALSDFDEMMVECVFKVEKGSALALQIQADVLEELARRGKAKLISGSFDDIGNALIQRL